MVYLHTQQFFMQMLRRDEERVEMEQKNPFVKSDEEYKTLASKAYRYRLFELGTDIKLVIRCEQDAVLRGFFSLSLSLGYYLSLVFRVEKMHDFFLSRTGPMGGDLQFLNIFAFNEWDTTPPAHVDWRKNLDTQRGKVITTEMKNNSCKCARWTVQALLAGSDLMKFG